MHRNGDVSHLHICLLGPLELNWEGRLLPLALSTKARSLLGYLVLYHDRVFHRDKLAGDFWPERPDAAARRALTQALWQVRRSLGPAAGRLAAGRDTVSFHLQPGDWLDVAALESACAPPAHWDELGQAVALYQADFLEGIYDDWALLERERLRELYLGALEQLVAFHKQRDDYEQALAYAQRLAAADPLRESAHRELMRLYHLLNRPQAALKQFATLRALLAEEMGVPPSPASAALYREIAAASGQAAAPHLPVAALPPPLLHDPAHLPFIGRRDERAVLLHALQAAARGHGGLALVEGDAGVGKTRLVSEIGADARWRGFQVGLSKADPLATSAPYQCLQDALQPLLTPLRVAQLAELVEPHWLGVAGQVLASLRQHLPDWVPSAPALQPAAPSPKSLEQQQRVWEGLARCLAGLASVAPLLLILEDLHWADQASLAALPHLAGRLGGNRLFLLVTWRIAEARERAVAWEALQLVDCASPLTRLRLLPFDPTEVVTMVQRSLGIGEADEPSIAFARRLQSETGGNALFLVEMLKALLEQGALLAPAGEGWVYPGMDQTLPTPATIQELVAGRVGRLARPLRRVLEWAAVLGEDAHFAALANASGQAPAALLPALEELSKWGFLVEASSRYRFEHDRIQETVYQLVPPKRRRALHRQAGAALEQLSPGRVESLAYHFAWGQVWDKAALYNRQAGERARAVYASAEAIAYYGQAIEAWRRSPSLGEQLGLELYYERGRICQETGRFDQAGVDFQTAYNLAEQIGDVKGQARVLNSTSYLHFQCGDFEAAQRAAEQALALAVAAGLEAETAAGLFNKANALRNMGRYQLAIEFYERAVAAYESLGDQACLADALNRMGAAVYAYGDYARARSLMERSLAIRRRLGDKVGIAYSLINLSNVHYYLGQFADTRQAAQEALEVARAAGDPSGEDAALLNLGLAALEQGAPAQALPLFEQALDITHQIGDQAAEPEILAGLGEAYYYLGDLERAADLLQQAWECASISIDRDQIPVLYARLARLNLGAGRVGQALDQARAGLQIAQEINQPWCKGVLHRVVGEAIGVAGGEQAEREAFGHFEASVRMLRELKAEAELARSLAAYGLYVEAGTPAGAAMLDEARHLFQRLGMAGEIGRLDADLRLGQEVRLPHVSAPTGRPLRDDEYVTVTWTPAVPEDEQIPATSARRHHRLLRLLRAAAAQSAAPTVTDLAAALGATERTIKRDLAALRAAGHPVRTRGSRKSPSSR